MSSPFTQHALDFLRLDLSIIPCGGKDGKRALIKWRQYQKFRPYEPVLLSWMEKYPDANIGIVTGRISGLTIIDSDNPKTTLDTLENTYGQTPFVVQSPRGGLHLYYRHSGEKNAHGMAPAIDMRGEGGLIIGPHSINSESNRA